MANFCHFDIYFRGKRGNVLLLCYSIATTEEGAELLYDAGTDDLYKAHIQGICAWFLDYGVTDQWDGAEVARDLNRLSEDELYQLGEQCMGYSLRAKSRVLHCDIMARSWDDGTEFDLFKYFRDGRCVKTRQVRYSKRNEFGWNTMEYVRRNKKQDKEAGREQVGLLYASLQGGENPLKALFVAGKHPGDEDNASPSECPPPSIIGKFESPYARAARQITAAWEKQYGSYISDHPVVTIPGKKFAFTGFGIFEEEHPVVQRVIEQAGCSASVSPA